MPTRSAEQQGEVQQWSEKAVSDALQDLNYTPDAPIVAEITATLAENITPVPETIASDATRQIAADIAGVLARHGQSLDAGEIEAFLAGRGSDTPVHADGPLSADDEEKRFKDARAAAQQVIQRKTSNAKKWAVYEAIKASPPYMFYNREARLLLINGYPIPVPAGRIEPKRSGEAGVGCLFVARMVGEWEDFRLYEQQEKQRLREQVLHGEDYDIEAPAVASRGVSPLLPPPV